MCVFISSMRFNKSAHTKKSLRIYRIHFVYIHIYIYKSLKDCFDTATSISRAFCEQTGKPISRKKLFFVG